MPDTPKWDRVFATASWIIVLALLYGAVVIWFGATPSGQGPVAKLIGITGSQVFYSSLYGLEALVLGYSKAFKKKRLRKGALMAIYITGFFTSILSIAIAGFTPNVIDNLLLALLAAGCWLYWKFKTEYINPQHFAVLTQDLRDDFPPKP